MTMYVKTDIEKLSELLEMAINFKILSDDFDEESGCTIDEQRQHDRAALLEYFVTIIDNTRLAAEQVLSSPLKDYAPQPDPLLIVGDLMNRMEFLIADFNELVEGFQDHDKELADLLRETFCSYGRQRDRRQQGNPCGHPAEDPAGSAIKTTTID
jgi:hypothetical protein